MESRARSLLGQIAKEQNPTPKTREMVAVLEGLLGALSTPRQDNNNNNTSVADPTFAQMLARLIQGTPAPLSQGAPEHPATQHLHGALRDGAGDERDDAARHPGNR